jgi:hypothetical protein
MAPPKPKSTPARNDQTPAVATPKLTVVFIAKLELPPNSEPCEIQSRLVTEVEREGLPSKAASVAAR